MQRDVFDLRLFGSPIASAVASAIASQIGVFFFLFFTLLCVSCGGTFSETNGKKRWPHPYDIAPHSLRVGNVILFEVSASGGLMPTAPRVLPEGVHGVPFSNQVKASSFAMAWELRVNSQVVPSVLGNNHGTLSFEPPTVAMQDYTSEFVHCPVAPRLARLITLFSAISQSNLNERDVDPAVLTRAVASLNSCELVQALTCLDARLRDELEQGAVAPSGQALVAAALSAQQCLNLTQSTAPLAPYFKVSRTHLSFFPAPLFSISIYEGAQDSYDKALSELEPVAVVPVAVTCTEKGKACLHSPLDQALCLGCASLKAGTEYTAFLLQRVSEPHGSVVRVTFTHAP